MNPRSHVAAFLLGAILSSACAAGPSQLALTTLTVQAGTGDVPDLVCRGRTPPKPRPPDPDPVEMPSEEDIDSALQAVPAAPTGADGSPRGIGAARDNAPFRVAIWGDSHLAAGFFNEELVRQLGLDPSRARPSLLPATFGRAGVRLPLRRSCVSTHWRYEPAYFQAAAAARPGPGLVNMVASDHGAELAFDLRNASRVAELRRVRVLYESSGATLRIGVSVDHGPEQAVTLDAPAGPAALELASAAPMSVLHLRLLEGRWRLHGLALVPDSTPALQLDVFGYPGATVASWKQADLDYFGAWFTGREYDLVMLEFGTNEGNDAHFDALAYRQLLMSSVVNLRSTFPAAACVLIGPGDRGVLVRRSSKARRKNGKAVSIKHSGAGKKNASRAATAGADAAPSYALLRYSRVHEQIAQIQQQVAATQGCLAWSAFDAMGGAGSAYRWAREKPPLMAADLTHFTVKGYQKLGEMFARDMGWTATQIWPRGLPAASVQPPLEQAAPPGRGR